MKLAADNVAARALAAPRRFGSLMVFGFICLLALVGAKPSWAQKGSIQVVMSQTNLVEASNSPVDVDVILHLGSAGPPASGVSFTLQAAGAGAGFFSDTGSPTDFGFFPAGSPEGSTQAFQYFPGDDQVEGNKNFTITVTTNSGDANYTGLTDTVNGTRFDEHTVIVSDVSGRTSENDPRTGHQVFFDVSLLTAAAAGTFDVVPTADVIMEFTVLPAQNSCGNDVAPALLSTSEQPTLAVHQFVTFTPGNYDQSQRVFVTGQDDACSGPDVLYKIQLTSITSNDPEYDGLPTNPNGTIAQGGVISAVNTSNDNPPGAGIIVTPNSGLITNENGATAQFSVVLGGLAPPTSNVIIHEVSSDPSEGTVFPTTLTFTPSNWNIPQVVTVTGVDDTLVDGNVNYSIIGTVDPSSDPTYANIEPDSVSVTNDDNETAGVTVSQTQGLVTSESGGQATFSVVLTSKPTSQVRLTLQSSDLTEGTVTPTTLVFDQTNWDTPQTVTVTGVDDNIVDGDVAYTVTISNAISSDTNYNGKFGTTVNLINLDDDVAGVTVNPTAGLVTSEDGTTDTFQVRLDAQPTAPVTINLTSTNTSEGTVSPATLTFDQGNWNTPQTVTVTGVDDLVKDGPQGYAILLSNTVSTDPNFNGLQSPAVSCTNLDNEHTGVTVSPRSGLITTESGGSASFTVVLTGPPTGTAKMTVTSSDTTEGTVSPKSLSFDATNWFTPQTVTVTGVDDSIDDGNIPYTIKIGNIISSNKTDPYNGLAVPSVNCVNIDNDRAQLTVTPTSGLTTSEAGGTAVVRVTLSTKPLANVTVNVASSDQTEGKVSPASVILTPTNFATGLPVTITGQDDLVADGNVTYQVTFNSTSTDSKYNGLSRKVNVVNTDNDTAGVIVTPTSGLVTNESGTTDTFTVQLTSQPKANVTMSLTSSDTTEATVSPSSITFTPSNFGPHTVTVKGVDDKIADGNRPFVIRTGALVSTDPRYNNKAVPDVSGVNVDNDDTLKPSIQITTPPPAPDNVYKTPPLATGTASDQGLSGLALVQVEVEQAPKGSGKFYNWTTNSFDNNIQNQTAHKKSAQGLANWSATLPNASQLLGNATFGSFFLFATATDGAGNTATTTHSFALDEAPPVISFTSPPGDNRTFTTLGTISGKVTDPGPATVASLTLKLFRRANSTSSTTSGYLNSGGTFDTTFNSTNNQLPVTVNSDSTFSFTLPLLSATTYTITLVAKDSVGNTSTATRTFTIKPQTGPATQFNPGQTYFFSTPFAKTNDAFSTIPVNQAFTLPPTNADQTVNYVVYKFDPLQQQFIALGGTSQLTRGQGYFLKVPASGQSFDLKQPADGGVVPLDPSVTEFTITLRRDPSLGANDSNGWNLIGFPFNPNTHSFADWQGSPVQTPDGQTFSSVAEAAAAGKLDGRLFEYDGTSNPPRYVPLASTAVIEPFKAYFVQTNVDGLKVFLRAGD